MTPGAGAPAPAGSTDTVDDYIEAQDADRRDTLCEIRRRILAAVPDAVEAIRYGMPAFRFPNGHPVYVAGWKQHVSLHDIPTLAPELEAEAAQFRSGKDTLKFRHRDPVPFDLITRIIVAIAERPA